MQNTGKHKTEVMLLHDFFSFLMQKMTKFEKQMESYLTMDSAHDHN